MEEKRMNRDSKYFYIENVALFISRDSKTMWYEKEEENWWSRLI